MRSDLNVTLGKSLPLPGLTCKLREAPEVPPGLPEGRRAALGRGPEAGRQAPGWAWGGGAPARGAERGGPGPGYVSAGGGAGASRARPPSPRARPRPPAPGGGGGGSAAAQPRAMERRRG